MFDIIHLGLVAAAQAGYIGLRALQTRVIVGNQARWVVPISLSIAVFEVFVIGSIAKTALSGTWPQTIGLVIALGLGAGVGCLTAMRVHDRVTNGKH